MKRYISFCFMVVLCSALLSLTACTQNSSTRSNSGDTSVVSTTPVSTMSTYATSTPSPGSVTDAALALYQGDGYTISYPKTWKVTKSVNAVTFNDEKSTADFVVQLIPNPNGTIQPEKAITTELTSVQKSARNYKKLSIPATTTLNGIIWFQSGASADVQSNGHIQSGKVVAMATNHPAHAGATTLFSIMYTSSAQSFDSNNSTTFQPMLRSFKFS